jgi:hypothetical protein
MALNFVEQRKLRIKQVYEYMKEASKIAGGWVEIKSILSFCKIEIGIRERLGLEYIFSILDYYQDEFDFDREKNVFKYKGEKQE